MLGHCVFFFWSLLLPYNRRLTVVSSVLELGWVGLGFVVLGYGQNSRASCMLYYCATSSTPSLVYCVNFLWSSWSFSLPFKQVQNFFQILAVLSHYDHKLMLDFFYLVCLCVTRVYPQNNVCLIFILLFCSLVFWVNFSIMPKLHLYEICIVLYFNSLEQKQT